ncbi:MAG: two-component system, cell cycle sensor histidine kinase and response regulator CckA [Candidatus Sumerlaeota bacterium]|nr:two-component system, cell cycle sensor histidine kinase and response regulator CckA [Candidatus Sumerlaeota bacterium]
MRSARSDVRDAQDNRAGARRPRTHARLRRRARLEKTVFTPDKDLLRILSYAQIVAYRRIDGNQDYSFVSPGIEKLVGYSSDEMTDVIWRTLLVEVHPRVGEPGKSYAELHADVLAGRIPIWHGDYLIRRRDGALRWLSDMSVQLFEGSRHVGSIGILQDITERRHYEEERRQTLLRLQRVQRFESLGRLSAGVAHDFNNILAGILGNASLARADLPPDSDSAMLLAEIEQCAERAATLTAQMMAFAGKPGAARERTDLAELVREVLPVAETTISSQTPVAILCMGPSPVIEADASQIRQLLLQLLMNASEAILPGKGVITVEISRRHVTEEPLPLTYPDTPLAPGTYAVLTVRDDGAGMDAATLAQVFDPFFSTKETGRGLGLAAVAGTVRAHSGGVFIQSTPGQGTVVRVYLPLRESKAAGGHALSGKNVPDSDRIEGTVLIAEDNEAIRRIAARTLEGKGADVLEAGNGSEALVLFERHRHSLRAAVLDLSMPEVEGDEVYLHIRSLDPQLPVVLMSGYHELDMEKAAQGDTRVAFLRKPFKPSVLLTTLAKLLA